MKFKDAPNTMVITTKRIINKESIVSRVFHDKDDGMWQFLDNFYTDVNGAAIISIAKMVLIDSSIEFLSDLPLGGVAWRKCKDSDWELQVKK